MIFIAGAAIFAGWLIEIARMRAIERAEAAEWRLTLAKQRIDELELGLHSLRKVS